jgi:crotonobetainyl-CoA:carnitine CoA-transferase CaiB-like acyl-CoA transferase
MDSANGALSDVNVLDMSWVAAGPLCGVLFAYFGATVVRVESAVRVDVARVSPPLHKGQPGINNSVWYGAMNLGKYGVGLDLNSDAGKEIAGKLVDWADVVIEGFTPGTMAQWGLDYESLRARKPGIIMLSLTLQGQTGPLAPMRGYGLQVQGMSGMASLIGWPDGPPTGFTIAYPDYIVPMQAAFATVAVLDHRDRTGEGQHLDLAQMEATINFTGTAIPDYVANGRLELRAGNRLLAGDAPATAPHGAYPAKGDDRWIAISVFNQEEWQALCRVLGREDWLADARFATHDARCRNDAELDAVIAQETKRHDARALMERLQASGVPAGAVLDQQLMFEDAQLRHRDHFVPMTHPVWGEFEAEQFGVRMTETPVAIQRPAPLLAQHNEYVLRELLGYSEDDFNRLVAEGGVEFYSGE